MSSIKNISVKGFTAAAALLVVLAGGCNSTANSKFSSTLREPDPAQALVYAEAGLGASDALGHALFVEDGFRYAQANSVYEMAAAEQPGLKLRGAIYNTPASAFPEQVIVSAEDLHRQMLAEGKTWPGAATVVVSSVETQD